MTEGAASAPVVLGEVYRDVVSGFVGTATGRAEYLYEPTTVLLVAETKQASADSRWIAEARLERASVSGVGFGKT